MPRGHGTRRPRQLTCAPKALQSGLDDRCRAVHTHKVRDADNNEFKAGQWAKSAAGLIAAVAHWVAHFIACTSKTTSGLRGAVAPEFVVAILMPAATLDTWLMVVKATHACTSPESEDDTAC